MVKNAAMLAFLCASSSAFAAGVPGRDRLADAEMLAQEGRNDEAMAAAQGALADAEKGLGPDAPEWGRLLCRISGIYETAGADAQYPDIEKRLSAVKPKDSGVLLALGRIQHLEGKAHEAEDSIEQSLALKPDDFAGVELARIYDEEGRFEDEVRFLEAIVARRPRAYFYSQLAIAYNRTGRFAKASDAYSRARKINGDAVNSYIEQGYFNLRVARPALAKEAFESAVAIDTANPKGFHHLGAYLASKGQLPEAEKYLRQALAKWEANPESSDDDIIHTLLWLGEAIRDQGRYPEAEAIFLRALSKARPGSYWQIQLMTYLAVLYVRQGKNVQAEETYKRAAAICAVPFQCQFPDTVAELVEMGQFYVSQGRRAEAAAAAERIEKLSADVPPGHVLIEALRSLSDLYRSLGDETRNRALYMRLVPIRRAAPFDSALIWVDTDLADLDVAQVRYLEAEEHYRLAIATLDHDGGWRAEADVLDKLAVLFEKAGRGGAGEARKRAHDLRIRLKAG